MKTTPKKQENKPLIAECYLCGYRTPVSSHDDPLLFDFCPNCGGFIMDVKGNITYEASMQIIDVYEKDDEWVEFLNSNNKKKATKNEKKTTENLKEPCVNEPQEWKWLKYTYFKDKEEFKQSMKWAIAFIVFVIGIVAFSSVFAQEKRELKVYDIGTELYKLREIYETEGTDTIYWTDCDWDKSLMARLGIRTTQRIIDSQYKTLSDLNKHLNKLGYNVIKDIVIEKLENNESTWLENDRRYSLIFVKGNSPQYFEKDDFDSTITHNRNPRGVLLVKKVGFKYEIVTQNLDFLDSGEENGGVYFAPELSIGVSQKKLIIDYNHGRYGNWGYEYSFNGNDFIVTKYYLNESYSAITEDVVKFSINFTEKIITYSHIINEDEYMANDVDAKYHTIIIPFTTNVIFTMSNRPRYNN